ncbi:MAG: dTDP-4-dehydrorhamnose reductase [Granulosicoccus sp.]
MMRVFITGSDRGQLHWELIRSCPADVEIVGVAPRLDLYDTDAIGRTLFDLQPDAVINAAAYTAVDKAESEPDNAHALNTAAVEQLALAAKQINARLLHVSTDFVFGKGDGSPFSVDAATDPVSVYGQSKLAGEQALMRVLPDNGTIIRTAWVYSSHGNNFVKTMLRLMQERDELGVIADQVGSPTWAYSLAQALWRSLELEASGVFHWTGAGVASWYDFAVAIAEEANQLSILHKSITINPLTTEQYPTPACRPAYSVLQLADTWQTLGMNSSHWRTDLRSMLKELI